MKMKIPKINTKDITLARQYVKDNIWKQFFKQKLYELGIIPLGILSIWKIPYWTGLGFIKLFGIDPGNNTHFCKDNLSHISKIVCDGTINIFSVWFFGCAILAILMAFMYVNWQYAKEKVMWKALKKYPNISNYSLRYETGDTD